VVKQWCKEIKVGNWQSGEGHVTFEPNLFSWVTQREVPGVGFVSLKLRTSGITSAIFDKKTNLLKIRGFVEVPMNALDRWYDSFSNPGSPKGYLCLKFQNYGEFTDVIKAVPRLKENTTFSNAGAEAASSSGVVLKPGSGRNAAIAAAARLQERVSGRGGSSAGSRQVAAASSGKQPERPKPRPPPPHSYGPRQTTLLDLHNSSGHSSGSRRRSLRRRRTTRCRSPQRPGRAEACGLGGGRGATLTPASPTLVSGSRATRLRGLQCTRTRLPRTRSF